MHAGRTRRTALVVLLTAAASGCYHGPVRTTDRDVSFDATSGDALVVFALTPNMVVTLTAGTDDGVSWHCERGQTVRVRPQDGFVVARLRPRTGKHRYAIRMLSTDASGLTAWHTPAQLLAFDAPPGQVTYLGAWRVEFPGGTLPEIVADPDVTYPQAEAFMAANFANVRAPVVTSRMDWLYR